jgi:hypothetical protein
VGALQGAAGTAASMGKEQKTETTGPEKTAGGAIASGVMGAMGGHQLQSYLFPETAKMGGGAAATAAATSTAQQMAQAYELGNVGGLSSMLGGGAIENFGGFTGAAPTLAESTTAGAGFGPWGAAAGAAVGLLSYFL